MNVANLILNLQNRIAVTTSLYEIMAIAKVIEKLNVGFVTTVDTLQQLPINLSTSGNLYYVNSTGEMFYNIGSTWRSVVNFSRLAWGVGRNNVGQVGINSISNITNFQLTSGNLGDWLQVTAGVNMSAGIVGSAGARILYAWGVNYNGSLGDNSVTNKSSPVSVVSSVTNWRQVDVGNSHMAAVTEDGQLYSWGTNTYGRLGTNDTTARSTPTRVAPVVANWVQTSCGHDHSGAVTSSGLLYTWGHGGYGGLGSGDTVSRSSPATVIGGITNWLRVSCGFRRTMGLTSSGVVYGWGSNSFGELGDNTTVSKSSPVTITGGITNWSQVSAGMVHTMALTNSGLLYGWGRNHYGQLGDGTSSNRSSPSLIAGGVTGWTTVVASKGQSGGARAFSMGITSTGQLYGWGNTTYNQFGAGGTVLVPTQVGTSNTWFSVGCGYTHSIAASSNRR